MFMKDSRELYFVMTEKLQSLQNSSANLNILGILANFRRYFFSIFFLVRKAMFWSSHMNQQLPEK